MEEPKLFNKWTEQDVRFLMVAMGCLPIHMMTTEEVEFALWDKQFWADDIDAPKEED